MEFISNIYFKYEKLVLGIVLGALGILFLLPFIFTQRVYREYEYTKINDVSLYLMKYHELPKNYITKGSIENTDNKGFIIGGDSYFNHHSLADYNIKDESLKYCDIYFSGYSYSNRGSEALVFTTNTKRVRVFYSNDNFKSFSEISSFRLQLVRNILWIIFFVFIIIIIVIARLIYVYNDKIVKKQANIKKLTYKE